MYESNLNNPNVVDAVDPDELSVAEKEAESSTGTYTHKFRIPYTYQGKTYTELTFDWDSLTGRDGLAAETELQALGIAMIVPTFSGPYLIRIAARACTKTIGADAFEYMPITDYNRIRSAARSFLLASE
ncbi:MAG: phage tail assembly protein [Oscillospiraceae bacterium]|jgi:hypothetical protein|nr:phage tail assembly protein [Oscillospiraceae bacterium]